MMKRKKSLPRIPDLIMQLKLGKMELPEDIDKDDFINYLKELSDIEEKGIIHQERIFSRTQALLIIWFTGILAFCAAAELIWKIGEVIGKLT